MTYYYIGALLLAAIALRALYCDVRRRVRASRRSWQPGAVSDLRPGAFVRLTWSAANGTGELAITGMVLTRTLAGVSLTEGFIYADDLATNPPPTIEVYR